MNIVGVITLCGLVVGLAIGLAMVFLSSIEFRTKAEGQLLRFGSGGTLFMLVWSLVSTGRAAVQSKSESALSPWLPSLPCSFYDRRRIKVRV